MNLNSLDVKSRAAIGKFQKPGDSKMGLSNSNALPLVGFLGMVALNAITNKTFRNAEQKKLCELSLKKVKFVQKTFENTLWITPIKIPLVFTASETKADIRMYFG